MLMSATWNRVSLSIALIRPFAFGRFESHLHSVTNVTKMNVTDTLLKLFPK